MPGIIAPEFDSSDLRLLMKVNSLDAVHAGLYVFFSVQHLVRGNVAYFDIVWQQPTEHNTDKVQFTCDVKTNNYKHSAPKILYKCLKLYKD